MQKVILSLVFIFLFIELAFSQNPVVYSLNLENINHHELKVSVVFDNLKQDVLEIRMPNSSPGRYAEHTFIKNVYEEKAFSNKGKPLKVERITPFGWKVATKNGYVRFEYTLFGNHADGTYTGIDAKRLHLNMPASFVYGVGLEDQPIQLNINLNRHPHWTVATQLIQQEANVFTAPNYYYFYDSPTMAGDIDWRRWEVDGQTIEIAMMHEGTDDELDSFTEWVKHIVSEEKEIYGELPQFDYGRYTFLMSYNPWVHGDGMEHRNSTICSSSRSLAESARGLIGTVSHEFFHAWNVERIRPASLEPFDFDEANLSGELWFAEGFTSYYDDLVLCRAGIRSPEEYVTGLTGTMNYVLNSPGRSIRNPIQMSHNAPFVDAATSNDETNYSNNFISYYSYGSVLGLALDLMLREKFEEVTLDDYMKKVWETYGEPEAPYKIEDLQSILGDLTRKKFARQFFSEYIYQSNLPDFKGLLSEFGMGMDLADPGKVYFGYTKLNNQNALLSTVLRGTALYEAGVEKGDILISVDHKPVTSGASLRAIQDSLIIGREYKVVYNQLGEEKSGTFLAKQDPSVNVSFLPEEMCGEEQLTRRKKWLEIEN